MSLSPMNTPGGTKVWLRKSTKSATGYQNVIEPHPGKFSVKYNPEPGVKKQKHLPGSSSATALEAAIKYAKFLGPPEEQPPKRRRSAVRTAGPAALTPTARPLTCADVCASRKKASRWRRPSPSTSRTRLGRASRSGRSCAPRPPASAATWRPWARKPKGS